MSMLQLLNTTTDVGKSAGDSKTSKADTSAAEGFQAAFKQEFDSNKLVKAASEKESGGLGEAAIKDAGQKSGKKLPADMASEKAVEASAKTRPGNDLPDVATDEVMTEIVSLLKAAGISISPEQAAELLDSDMQDIESLRLVFARDSDDLLMSDTESDQALALVLQQLTPLMTEQKQASATPFSVMASTPMPLAVPQSAATALADVLAPILTSVEESGLTVKTAMQNWLNQQNMDKPNLTAAQIAGLLVAQSRQVQPSSDQSSLSGGAIATISNSAPAASSGVAAMTTSSTTTFTVQPQLDNTAWGRVVSSRVSYMAKEGIQQAELRLNPASLGPVEVRLQLQQDQASVTFLAQNQATREALEQALPRLRDSLAEQGLSLTQADVGQQQADQSAERESSMENAHLTQVSVTIDDSHGEQEREPDSVIEHDDGRLSLYA
ncbi:Flagellar hook-length control protein FliK [Methylophaga frappieri]|uniref:Flagellar hook-length control protein FliK n=1 Tax=Methylophaga frappieri (strain ATCC BAA-2434 / DSM 25690 / JAM7) TaxID=754477 RepID=I1YKP9_METFJ|nr:flagellar hook-length control protein FliK [Methylophaga frappieri]AFJ03492.1 Flagellar hook-length control protein FliK [Methylophaga frappieri]